jgi:predicted DnaQ family exonuclease/DinG family helicase
MKEYLKELKLDEFIVFDLETTGTDCHYDKIIEIAAVKYRNGEIVSRFSHLIDPGIKISENISLITGITNEDVKGKPDIDEVLPDFIEYTGTTPLVAHNIQFDLGFINENIKRSGELMIPSSGALYDTLLLSQIFFPVEVHNHKLSSLAEYFGLRSDNLHRAVNDCETTGYVFLKIIEKAVSLTDSTVKKLVEVSGRSGIEYINSFFHDLGNYYLRTSFSRRMNAKEKPYSFSNILERTEEPDEEKLKVISDKNIIDKIFCSEGVLKQTIHNYEYREEQHIMAVRCADAFRNEKILVSEAGTGVGKSFAYLVPAIVFSLLNEERIIISTNTKNLQEQIFFKDLPVLHEMFRSSFKAVLLKGRNNYLCRNRYERILERPDEYLSKDEYEKFIPLIYWAEKTRTGDIEENNGFKIGYSRFLWNKLVSDKGFCSGKKCPMYNECYLQNIRKSAFKSDLVIINHSLLFSDMASENAVLGSYSHLVIDESHNVENAATKYLGYEYNYFQMKNLSQRINYNNKHGVNVRIERGLEWFKTDRQTIKTLNDQLLEKCKNTADQTKKIFESASWCILSKQGNDNSFLNIRNRYQDISDVFTSDNDITVLRFLYEELTGILKRLEVIMNMEAEKNHDFDDLSAEIKSVADQAEELSDSFEFFINSSRENYVFWYELTGPEDKSNLGLFAAPLEVASILKSDLYDNMKTIIFTSATMTIESRFKYMTKKLGLDSYTEDRLDYLLLGTPFDLRSQLKMIAPSYIANPKMSVVYETDVKEILKHLCLDHDNGTLVLFTNYSQMNSVYRDLKDVFEKKERLLAVQNRDTSRTNLIKQFKAVRNSFLLGTDSFWEGIDVPGDALHTLIITKLPFAVPTEPVIQARTEDIEKRGEDSFMGYSVPETILKFRQGIGRLIRHRNDTGIVLILDSRIVNTRWGRAFLNSLPVEPLIPRSYEELKRLLLN